MSFCHIRASVSYLKSCLYTSHTPIGWLSDLLVFGKRAGEYAARFSGEHGVTKIRTEDVAAAAAAALSPFDRGPACEGAYAVQRDLQDRMQALVGIVRTESEMREALGVLDALRARAAAVGVTGNRDYNPGWHTALDLWNLLDVSEAITRSALERRESRGGHYRDDFPAKDETWGRQNVLVRRAPDSGPDGGMVVEHIPNAEMPAELRQVLEEQG